MSDLYLRILLSATDAASSVIKGIAGSLGGSGLAGALAVAGTAAVGLGIASVNAASQFQTAMTLNEAHAGLAASQVQNVTNALLQMGPAVGQGPTQLAEALYPILSGFSGITNQAAKTNISLLELKLAAESVAGSTTSVTTASKAATAAFNAYGMSSNDAATNTSRMNNLFDVMNQTVSNGNMKWEQYATVIGKLSVASRGAGVSFNETNSALATLTNSGYSAQLGATYLSNMYTTLYLKADTLAKNAGKLGLSFDESKYKTMDLAGRLEYLKQVTGGNSSELLKLMGNNSTALKTFNALSGSIGQYKSDLQSANHAQGATADSFAKVNKTFGQASKDLQAAGQAILIQIGQKLLPILTPLVAGFAAWLTKSDGLSGAINKIASIIGGFATGLGKVVTWFQQGSGPAQAVAIALAAIAGGFAAIQIGAFVAAVPALVAGFLAWAGAAGAAAIATIAATWPLFAIGAAVVIAVGIIIVVIKNWGAIAHWIQGVWKAVTSAIGGFFSGLGSKVHEIIGGIGQKFSQLGSKAQDVKKSVGQHFSDLGTNVHNSLTTLGTNAIKAFQWLYNHNIYFKMLVDDVVKLAHNLQAWLEQAWDNIKAKVSGAWSAISDFITTKWNYIQAMAEEIFRKVRDTIQAKMQAIHDLVVSVWTTITSWLSTQWNKFAFLAQQAWQKVSGVFSSIWSTYISGPLSSLWNNISGWFGNLAGQALNWGKNLIQGFINGINSMIGGVGQAASNIAGQIGQFLGFHSPTKKGPGSQAHLWAPALVTMFSNDLKAHTPKAERAAESMMAYVAKAIKAYPAEIARATLSGNTTLRKSLEQQRRDMELQMRQYKALITLNSDRYSSKNINDLIVFGSATKKATRASSGVSSAASAGAMTDTLLQQIIVLLGQGFGISTAGGVSSIPYYTERGPAGHRAGRSGAGGGGTTINITISTLAGTRTEVRRLADLIGKEIGHQVRAQTAGYSSGGIF